MEPNYFQILLGLLLRTFRRRVHQTWQELSRGLDGVKQWCFSAATYSSTYLKGFWQKLRQVRNVSKVHLLTLLNKRLFFSCLSLPSPPRPTQTSLHKVAFIMFLTSFRNHQHLIQGLWKSTEKKLIDFRILIIAIQIKTSSCYQSLRVKTIAINW